MNKEKVVLPLLKGLSHSALSSAQDFPSRGLSRVPPAPTSSSALPLLGIAGLNEAATLDLL